MNVTIQLFAAGREVVGADSINVDLIPPASVSDLRRAIAERYPELAAVMARSLFAINAEYADDETSVPELAELAMIPPVSGG